MQFASMNWRQVEEYLEHDDRCIFPIGCTEQHAYLSLLTDSILAEKISRDAAEPLNIPVLPVMPFGITPAFMAYPGTITLRPETLLQVVTDVLDSLAHHGFKRILIVNGHGGNAPIEKMLDEWKAKNTGVKLKFHNWWNAPQAWAKVQEIDPVASHASWMENFSWTRTNDSRQPKEQKAMVDFEKLRAASPDEVRTLLGDGNYGGYYQRPDTDTDKLWEAAVKETRALLESW